VAPPRANESVAREVAKQITQALKAPIECEELNRELKLMEESPIEYDSSIDVGASIGIAVYPEDGVDDQSLLRRADIAMYAAKRNHAKWALFDPTHEVARLEHLSLVSDLRRAVAEAELRAFYQPKVDVQTGRVIGAEALVRWEHPQRGLLSPAEFMPYAEQTGHITWVTRWMLAVTLRQCGAWAAAGVPLQVAVNLSNRDLLRTDLVGDVRKRLADHAVPPHLVCLEITEGTFMQDPERALKVLHELHALGVHLSIDDFGTGFSSLSYMKRLPVHELKIDSTFVQGMASGKKDVAIVRSTIELAHNLGLKVVAEGVENEVCLGQLRDMGCDIAQGYLLAKPMRRKYFERWLKQAHGIEFAAAPTAGGDPQIEHIELAG
jgi:EAL domain-containing protein (putative c-di-GMP-specific phosphodiesterase class I)